MTPVSLPTRKRECYDGLNSPGTTADSSRRGSIYSKGILVNQAEVNKEWLEKWLSAPRYASYYKTAKNDSLAFELYLWNTGLAQAILRDISFFEIALRNAYDRCISNYGNSATDWLFDLDSPVRRAIERKNSRGKINDANRVNRSQIDKLNADFGETNDHDKVVSNLMLGFWCHMADRNHERELWIPCIHKAWPKGTKRKTLYAELATINRLRNRAAHHERLFILSEGQPLPVQTCESTVALFRTLAPEAAAAIYGKDACSTALAYTRDNPAPCQVAV